MCIRLADKLIYANADVDFLTKDVTSVTAIAEYVNTNSNMKIKKKLLQQNYVRRIQEIIMWM